MSIFDYPRINFKGTIQLNPGTANNDDYAPYYTLPASWGPPFAGMPLALIDSKNVQARTYGKSDDDFIAWVQQQQTFDVVGTPGQTAQVIPAEWNYYGGMEMSSIAVKVIGVQTGPSEISSEANSSVPLTNLLGAELAISNGHITDVNSEGSPPATQFFIDGLTLSKGGTTFIKGSPSKGACQWLNFYRNANLTADGGAGGYVYHVMRKSQAGTIIDIPGFDDPNVVGAILRYYLFRPMETASTPAQIEAVYQQKQANPATLEIVGTIAPLHADEDIVTTPKGRLMVSNTAQIPTPPGSTNNSPNGLLALAPAVLRVANTSVSADFVGTFPDYYQKSFVPLNDKYYFGEVSLVVSAGANSAVIGAVDYANTLRGDQQGWVLDFDISSNAAAQQVLQDANASFQLVHPKLGVILAETDYYFVSNQQAIYAEQFGSGSEFLNQGTREPATVLLLRHGLEIPAHKSPGITVWQYRSIPLEDPGNAVAISTNHTPGRPIIVDTSQPGNFLFTFSITDDDNPGTFPPPSYGTFMNPPYVTNAPSISLRILPNSEDFSQYYVDPEAPEPVGNDSLTFDVLYEKVLRTYYLLYPVMIPFVKLNSEADVAKNAQAILRTTDASVWMSADYMPRSRDMSASRVRLLQAWCRKVQTKGGTAKTCQ
ncbi:MAG TPA: hypothetical protein VFX97_12140 [Pyrinomonadaceae bacterium]|nr:hypothetical protein [Pyrinomonadaceae bacterium]